MSSSTSSALLSVFGLLLLIAAPGSAGTLVDPGGLVEDLIADPARNVFYATLDTDEIVTVSASSPGVTNRVAVPGNPRAIAIAPDGSKLYVALTTTQEVAEYDLPAVTFSQTFALSGTHGTRPPGLAVKRGRLYVTRSDGLSVIDTATGAELYFDDPTNRLASWSYTSVLRLSPDGNTLYAMDTGLSPASIIVLDLYQDTPTYIGEDCCHGCIGGNGRSMELSPDGRYAYVVVGGQYHLQVLKTSPLLHDAYAGTTGPYPNAVARSVDGSRVYVGYQDSEFAVVRTSDWLPFHVGALQGDVVSQGLALAYDQHTLAAVIEFTNFDPDRIEIINVASPVPNRGGIRVRPLDNVNSVPISGARIQDPVFEGNSAFIDVGNGYLARAPIEAANFDTDISAFGYTTETRNVTVVAGSWTDLGTLVMTRTGDMADPSEVCASPTAVIGETVDIDITGKGFFSGAGLEVTSSDPDVTIESYAFSDWSTISATVTVAPGATPGRSGSLRVTNPDGGWGSGSLLKMHPDPRMIFTDGFESGDSSAWSGGVP